MQLFSPRLFRRWLIRLPVPFGDATVVIAGLVLAAWLAAPLDMRQQYAFVFLMKANTALGFLCAGVATSLAARREARGVVRVGGGIALALGALTLVEYLTGGVPPIDELLVRDPGGLTPGRMPLQSALGFMALGAGLLGAGAGRPAVRRFAELAAAGALLVGFVGLIGYVYGAWVLLTSEAGIHLSPQAAVCFQLLGVSLLLLHADSWLLAWLTRDDAGSAMGRRMLPAALVVPPLIGWLGLLGERRGWYDSGSTVALQVGLTMVVLVVLVLRASVSLSASHRVRQQAEKALFQLHRPLDERLLVLGVARPARAAARDGGFQPDAAPGSCRGARAEGQPLPGTDSRRGAAHDATG